MKFYSKAVGPVLKFATAHFCSLHHDVSGGEV